MQKIPKYFLLLTFFLSVNFSFAQLEAHEIDGEGWAKGDFVEIGINAKGVYGAQTANRPASFHDNREINNFLFGFVANPVQDGWVDYDGDFFTPGSPEEGFAIEIDGVNYNNNNEVFVSQIPGEVKGVTVLSSDCFEDTAQIAWEGNVQGLNIKRYYSVTKDGLFIQMTTVVKNISTETKNNVFFMHNVDPDNNQTLSGVYDTDLRLTSQASSPTDNICLVTASQNGMGTVQDMDGSYVSFYARDERARVTFGGFANRVASRIWNGTDADLVNTEGVTRPFIDEAISIAFRLDDIAPNEVEKFTYYYILKDVDETFVPFIVNAFQENPTVCDGEDGKITFSGLTTGESYTISYFDDGVFVPEVTYVADAEGEVVLENLDEGTYSNIKITFAGCDTFIDTIYELKDPEVPNYTFTKEDLTDCGTLDGVITIHGLTPFTNYTVSYTYNGTPVGPLDLMADIDGNIVLSGIDRGIYTDFVLEQFECVTASPEVIELIGEIPDFTFTKEDLTDCGTLDGEIIINGLTPSLNYFVSYTYNGIPIGPLELTTNTSGNIIFSALDRGIYTNFVIERSDCIATSPEVIEIIGPPIPIAYPIPDQFYCDEDYDFITNIDFSPLDVFIIGADDPADFNITYHATELDVSNSISVSKTNYTTNGTATYTIYAKKTELVYSCYDYVPFNITIQLPPDFEIEDTLLCVNSNDTTNYDYTLPIISTGLSNTDHTFEWYYEGTLIPGETSNELTVDALGEYSVNATFIATGCDITKSATVYPSGPPQILEVEITSQPFAENHVVEITVSGHGDYVFAIDDEPYQTSPIFTGISAGYHEFHVIDLNGCGIVTVEKMVIDYMKFFTPNEDTYKDYWQIIGIEELKNVSIHIFDRQGKLLKELSPYGRGWDGTFNGEIMPATDYWFSISFDDDNGSRRDFKAHFALRR
jgi:gliding motility-associated-like protein